VIWALFIAAVDPFAEFLQEPVLSVAAVLLIVVSVGWIIMSRLITRAMKKAAYRAMTNKERKRAKPARDIWNSPP
jgi:hypothetical protein